MLDLRRLRLLRELAHRGTLAAVAEALSYSPSTVSQQLSQLESEAGVALLEPVGRRVRLTPQAQILVAYTERILEQPCSPWPSPSPARSGPPSGPPRRGPPPPCAPNRAGEAG
jgi:DNA-binding transcriptional ArsR family regulator